MWWWVFAWVCGVGCVCVCMGVWVCVWCWVFAYAWVDVCLCQCVDVVGVCVCVSVWWWWVCGGVCVGVMVVLCECETLPTVCGLLINHAVADHSQQLWLEDGLLELVKRKRFIASSSIPNFGKTSQTKVWQRQPSPPTYTHLTAPVLIPLTAKSQTWGTRASTHTSNPLQPTPAGPHHLQRTAAATRTNPAKAAGTDRPCVVLLIIGFRRLESIGLDS